MGSGRAARRRARRSTGRPRRPEDVYTPEAYAAEGARDGRPRLHGAEVRPRPTAASGRGPLRANDLSRHSSTGSVALAEATVECGCAAEPRSPSTCTGATRPPTRCGSPARSSTCPCSGSRIRRRLRICRPSRASPSERRRPICTGENLYRLDGFVGARWTTAGVDILAPDIQKVGGLADAGGSQHSRTSTRDRWLRTTSPGRSARSPPRTSARSIPNFLALEWHARLRCRSSTSSLTHHRAGHRGRLRHGAGPARNRRGASTSTWRDATRGRVRRSSTSRLRRPGRARGSGARRSSPSTCSRRSRPVSRAQRTGPAGEPRSRRLDDEDRRSARSPRSRVDLEERSRLRGSERIGECASRSSAPRPRPTRTQVAVLRIDREVSPLAEEEVRRLLDLRDQGPAPSAWGTPAADVDDIPCAHGRRGSASRAVSSTSCARIHSRKRSGSTVLAQTDPHPPPPGACAGEPGLGLAERESNARARERAIGMRVPGRRSPASSSLTQDAASTCRSARRAPRRASRSDRRRRRRERASVGESRQAILGVSAARVVRGSDRIRSSSGKNPSSACSPRSSARSAPPR